MDLVRAVVGTLLDACGIRAAVGGFASSLAMMRGCKLDRGWLDGGWGKQSCGAGDEAVLGCGYYGVPESGTYEGVAGGWRLVESGRVG